MMEGYEPRDGQIQMAKLALQALWLPRGGWPRGTRSSGATGPAARGSSCAPTSDLRRGGAGVVRGGAGRPGRGRARGPAVADCPGGARRLRPARRGPLQRRRPDDPARPGGAARVAPLAERLLRDVFDAGLVLGHSVRTPEQACRLACGDPMICTSLMESRLLAGDERAFRQFHAPVPPPGAPALPPAGGGDQPRRGARSGPATAKRCSCWSRTSSGRGALRDIHLVRWIGFARYGSGRARPSCRPAARCRRKTAAMLERAGEFLLWLAQRIALPCRAGQRRAQPGRAAPHRRAARLPAGRRHAAGRAVHARLFPPHQRRQPRGRRGSRPRRWPATAWRGWSPACSATGWRKACAWARPA